MTDRDGTLYLSDALQQTWRGVDDLFGLIRELPGEEFRNREGRRTFRTVIGNAPCFVKYHSGIGWGEILKNLLQGKRPVLGARNEWEAIQHLTDIGVDTLRLAAYGERGQNPARRESFVITHELQDTVSLEHLGSQWKTAPPRFSDRRRLIERLADISRRMHDSGLNHRDYYLCHFLTDSAFSVDNRMDDDRPLYLIDLHRARIRSRVPERWRVKDLAGLYFSALDVPLSRHDRLRFMRRYRQLPLRRILTEEKAFWARVQRRAMKLLRKTERHSQRAEQ